MFWQNLTKLFHPPRDKEPTALTMPEIKFRILVAEFSDDCDCSKGARLAQVLQNCEGIEIIYCNEPADKSFLNLESRQIFDLLDNGQALLDKNRADVLIWGYRNDKQIRLNFQNRRQYEPDDDNFVLLLDSLYIPASSLDNADTFPDSLANLLYGAAISAVNRPEKEYRIYQKYLLKKIVSRLAQTDSAKEMGLEYLPYILNFLGIIYMTLARESTYEEDFKIIRNLFTGALKYQNMIMQNTHLGCINYHLGRLYENAALHINKKTSACLRGAIKNMQLAQKYFGKYTYPYDYGYICYKLSELYFLYWKQSEDLQALRDAVFQLREAEKIFTRVLFPDFWQHIEGRLGYMLQNLGNLTQSRDISQLAVNAYRNQQQIITERKQPELWARLQNQIGEICYAQGKFSEDSEYLEEALACFHDALYIFEKSADNQMIKLVKANIAKSYNILSDLRNT